VRPGLPGRASRLRVPQAEMVWRHGEEPCSLGTGDHVVCEKRCMEWDVCAPEDSVFCFNNFECGIVIERHRLFTLSHGPMRKAKRTPQRAFVSSLTTVLKFDLWPLHQRLLVLLTTGNVPLYRRS
jgi:hypothetical protein